jgi:hypothetical protein
MQAGLFPLCSEASVALSRAASFAPLARCRAGLQHRKEIAMVAAKTLSQFRADQNDEGATLILEAEDGSNVEFEATFEQLELIADVLDDILSNNDDATEVKTEEEA